MSFIKSHMVVGVFLACIVALAFWVSCDDFGLDADFFEGKITGEMHLSEPLPLNTDRLAIALVKTIPPPSIVELHRANVSFVRGDTTRTVLPFELESPLEDFAAAIAIWKGVGQPWAISDIVGAFCDESGQLQRIELSDQNRLAENVIINVDVNKVKRSTRISGNINFAGEWPSDVTNLLMVFVADIQNITICNPPDIQTLPTRSAAVVPYSFATAPGLTNVLVVFQRASDALLSFNLVGARPFVTLKDSTVNTIDIDADFASAVPIKIE